MSDNEKTPSLNSSDNILLISSLYLPRTLKCVIFTCRSKVAIFTIKKKTAPLHSTGLVN